MANTWPAPRDRHGHVRLSNILRSLTDESYISFHRSRLRHVLPVNLVSGKLQLNQMQILPTKSAPVHGVQLLDKMIRRSGARISSRALGFRVYA
jgi:hypothetical protein